jgi:hypothetical protein
MPVGVKKIGACTYLATGFKDGIYCSTDNKSENLFKLASQSLLAQIFSPLENGHECKDIGLSD